MASLDFKRIQGGRLDLLFLKEFNSADCKMAFIIIEAKESS